MQNKKILTAAVALLMGVTPTLAINQATTTVKASRLQTGKAVIKPSYSGNTEVYTKNGGPALTTIKTNGHNMKSGINLPAGKTVTIYGNPVIFKGSKIQKGISNGTHYAPAAYLSIGKGQYLKALDLKSMNGQGILILNANSRVYTHSGKRTTFNGQSLIKKYMALPSAGSSHKTTKNDKYTYAANLSASKWNSLKTYKIGRSQYYYLGKGAYINAANVSFVNGNSVYQKSGTTTATLLTNVPIYSYKLKKTNKTLRAGQKVKVDQTKTTGEGDTAALYFRIAGTKGKNAQYLYWGDDAEYGMDQEGTTDEYQGFFNLRERLANF